jgi:hypothetical protein
MIFQIQVYIELSLTYVDGILNSFELMLTFIDMIGMYD